ncbi:MAG: NADH-quinone oxidoreductase subunit NuoK [Alphaproteobacteria bacterium]|nr:NADH-quinone oxidoreductase subunit NuoK [Alphaproteobacteria bacterium]
MPPLSVDYFMVLSAILFTIGLLGIFLNHKSLIHILMSLELLLLSVSLNFVGFSAAWGDLSGQIFALFILTIAAAEAAIGIAIVVVFYRARVTIDIDVADRLRG